MSHCGLTVSFLSSVSSRSAIVRDRSTDQSVVFQNDLLPCLVFPSLCLFRPFAAGATPHPSSCSRTCWSASLLSDRVRRRTWPRFRTEGSDTVLLDGTSCLLSAAVTKPRVCVFRLPTPWGLLVVGAFHCVRVCRHLNGDGDPDEYLEVSARGLRRVNYSSTILL